MANRLEKLPAELLLHTAEYISRPSDLKSLCLASKTLRDCALPSIYQKIVLDSISSLSILGADKGLLCVGNPGLVHVRELEMKVTADTDDCNAELRFLNMILSILPRDGLKSIDVSSLELDQLTVFSLLAQQQRLNSISLGPCNFSFTRLLQANRFNWNFLKDLNIPVTIGSDDLAAYQAIIQQAPHLSALGIPCLYHLQERGDYLDLTSRTDIVQQVLLAHTKEDESLRTMELDTLLLQNVTLSPTTAAVFDLSRIVVLYVWFCEGSHHFLSALTAELAKGECALRELTFEGPIGDPFDCELVEKLLRSFTGLKRLQLTSDNNEGQNNKFDVKCLDSHKATLELVMLGCYQINTDTSELDLDVSVFASFPKLQYLATPMPSITIPSAAEKSLSEYIVVARSMMSLPNLKVLRILTWPRVADGTFVENPGEKASLANLNRKSFLHDLDEFFNSNLSQHMLGTSIVTFKAHIANETHDGTTKVGLEPVSYVAEKRTDLLNHTYTTASRVTPGLAAYLEPGIYSWAC